MNLLLSILLVSASFTGRTTPVDSLVIKTSQTQHWQWLDPYLKLYIDQEARPEFLLLPEQKFEAITDNYLDRAIPLENTLYPHYFSFRIQNDKPDTVVYYYYLLQGGTVEVHDVDDKGNSLAKMPVRLVESFYIKQEVVPLKILPHSTSRFVVRAGLVQDRLQVLYMWIIPLPRINHFFEYLSGVYWQNTLTSIFTCGMLLMMLLYIFVKYWQLWSLQYLYYAGYIFLFFAFFLLKEVAFWNRSIGESPFYYSYVYKMLQVGAYCMYFLFAQQFLDTGKMLPKIHPWLSRIVIILVAYAILDLVLLLIPHAVIVQWQLWDGVRIFLLVSVVIFSLLLIKTGSPYARFLVSGSLALALGAGLSMILAANTAFTWTLPAPFNSPLLYFEIGIVVELLFFSSGLGYKNRVDEIEKVQAQEALKREGERLEFEQYKAATEAREVERSRIAKDLHDGLGGMLSGIKFSLEGIKEKTKLDGPDSLLYDRTLDQLGGSIQELRKVAHDMMPDVLLKQGLVAALNDYCQSLDDMHVLKIDFQKVGEEKKLESYREVVLYRIAQELLTNVMRHAQATEVLVQLVFGEQFLTMTVEDNGHGFDISNVSAKGLGLANLHSRLAILKGRLDIKTEPGEGTSVFIEIPYENYSEPLP